MLDNKFRIISIVLIAAVVSVMASCTGDLSTTPLDKDVTTSASLYKKPSDYRQVLAKLYAGFATTGQQGPAGDADIQGIDEGFSSYIRQYWVAQEIPTDEAVVGWNDPGLPQFNYQSWSASNDFVMGMYSRIYYEIALANEFVRQAKGNSNPEVQEYMAEARFIRAFTYWHALDLYGGGIPFVTEDDGVGAYSPKPASADTVFNYIESELKDVATQLPAPKQNEYGRVDKAAAWTLLARLYLNAETYVGESHYTEAITYAKKVIDEGGYQLDPNYGHLFMADNNTAQGIIFAVPFDGENTQTYGGTNFIVHAQVGGSMNASNFGLDGAWAGHRVTPQFVDKLIQPEKYQGYTTSNPNGNAEIYVPGSYQSASGYGDDWNENDAPRLVSTGGDVYEGYVFLNGTQTELKFIPERNWDTDYGDDGGDGTLETGGANIFVQDPGLYWMHVDLNNMTYELRPADSRNMLYTDGQQKAIDDIGEFSNGYAVTKWKNVTSDGQAGKRPAFVDTDFPMFRLADVYLMYAEAVVRGGQGGSMSRAVELVNDIRERAFHGSKAGDITSSQLTKEFILNERARELYWEGYRRTDLIRYDEFTGGNYVWAWKGQSQEGTSTDEHYGVFPLPASDVNANPKLNQNPGY